MWPLIIINTNKAKEIMVSKNNQAMIKEQIITRNITDKKVIEAMSLVDRELFVDQAVIVPIVNDSNEGPLEDTASSDTLLVAVANDSFVANQGAPLIIDIFQNDSNIPDDATLTFTDSSNGTISIDNNETPYIITDDIITYLSNTDF